MFGGFEGPGKLRGILGICLGVSGALGASWGRFCGIFFGFFGFSRFFGPFWAVFGGFLANLAVLGHNSTVLD